MAWESGVPVDSTTIGNVPSSIRAAKAWVKGELEREHNVLDDATPADACIHKKGSAIVYSGDGVPGVGAYPRPDGVTALGADDAGRIYFDYTNKIFYYWTGSAWTQATVKAPVVGTTVTDLSDYVKLNGTAGGQTVYGGTEAANKLTLAANVIGNTGGGIEITYSKTAYVDFADTPLMNMTMKSGETISGLATPTVANQPLCKGQAVISTTELSSTGGVPLMCKGSFTLSEAATSTTAAVFTLSAFSNPDFITWVSIGSSGVSGKSGLWIYGMGNSVYQENSITDLAITVSGNTVRFERGLLPATNKTLYVTFFKSNEVGITGVRA